jgi:TonB family protein
VRRLVAFAVLALAGCSTPLAKPVDVPIAPPPRPIPELLAEMAAPDAPSRAKAACALAGAGEVESAVAAALVAALDDPSDLVRECATWAVFHVSNPKLDEARLIDKQPTPVVITRPEYPNEAFRKKLAGTVTVDLLISATGKVVLAEIRKSIPGLDGAAIRCVRNWTFEPAQRRGKPVPMVASAPVTFRIY